MTGPRNTTEARRHRLFFAVWPDAATARSLADEARRLAPLLDGRAMHAETLHLTLAFLGDLPGDMRDRLLACGNASDRREWPGEFALRLDRLQLWRHNGIAFASSAQDCEPLHRLAALVSELSRSCGVPLPERRYIPHLTLLRRCRGDLPPATGEVGPWQLAIHAVRLVESSPSPAGASYRAVGEWALPQSSPVVSGR